MGLDVTEPYVARGRGLDRQSGLGRREFGPLPPPTPSAASSPPGPTSADGGRRSAEMAGKLLFKNEIEFSSLSQAVVPASLLCLGTHCPHHALRCSPSVPGGSRGHAPPPAPLVRLIKTSRFYPFCK